MRQGVEAEQVSDVANGRVGDMILSYAKDLEADLLVMGASGHSRLREIVLGSVVHQVLRRMDVPLLMAH